MPKISVGESLDVALFSVTEKVWIRGGDFQGIPSKVFCLTLLKTPVGESFTVALISGSENVYGQQWEGSIKIFRRKFFVSQSRKVS